mgnify:CR=1 FL=1
MKEIVNDIFVEGIYDLYLKKKKEKHLNNK